MKQAFDIVLALILLLLLSPVLVLLFVVAPFAIGRPVLFSQRRIGFKGKEFTIFKFRTMNNRRDAKGELLPDNQRLTPFGRFLRKTSLDELPQLFNILKGEMSFVGPRPLLCEYWPIYSDEQRRRHDVLPGITGWAQVNGRNTISWIQKFKYDIYYVDHASFGFDLKILWLTFLKVLKREGVNQSANDTMELFNGKN